MIRVTPAPAGDQPWWQRRFVSSKPTQVCYSLVLQNEEELTQCVKGRRDQINKKSATLPPPSRGLCLMTTMAPSGWKIHEPVAVPVPLIKPLNDTERFWKYEGTRLSGIVFTSVVLAGGCWPQSRKLGHGPGSILSPRWALFWGDFMQHLCCVGYFQRGAFNPKCTSSMFHAKVSDRCLWQQLLTDSDEFMSRYGHVGGEKLSKSMHFCFFAFHQQSTFQAK